MSGFLLDTYPVNDTIYCLFDSFAAATGAPSTISNFAVGDIKIYKNGSTTERASTNGFTLLDTDGIDFDAITGINGFSVDLSDNTTAGFYAAGAKYNVVISTITVDSQTVSFVVGSFRIIAAENTSGTPVVDVGRINNIAATSVTTVNANVGTTQPVNFTGTGASALAKSDVVDIAGAAVSTSSAQIGVNVVNAGGTAWGSGAITAASIAADAIGASELAADAATEIATAVWATATRSLTVLDEDSTTLDLDATIRAAVGLTSANLDTQLSTIDDFLDTEVAAIKAKTDQLTFGVSNTLNSNITHVNEVEVTGDGQSGTEWGPA